MYGDQSLQIIKENDISEKSNSIGTFRAEIEGNIDSETKKKKKNKKAYNQNQNVNAL